MTSQHEMIFPFTNREEILDWATRYIEDQKPKRKRQEEAVIDIKETVRSRQTDETPGGYLLKAELKEMGQWKSHYLPSKIDNNPLGVIKDVTGEAFRLDDDWEKLKKLKRGIHGVGESVASVILHLYDESDYPILDEHALRSVGINERYVHGPKYPFWQEYVDLCRAEAERYNVSMRTLDRALYKYSESGGVSALKIIADENLFLELKRRGYDLSKLRDEETTAGIIKIA